MESKADQRDLVIKVKYGESLKRLTASINKNGLNQNLATVRSKIIAAFDFTPTTDFILTYVDTDGDTVMLDDDEDLHDAAISQNLNPLRITVQLKSNASPPPPPPSSSAPKPQSPNPNPTPLDLLTASLKSLPEPFNDTISKVTEDIISKGTSGPVLNELLNVFSKLSVPVETTPQPANEPPKGDRTEPSKEEKKGPRCDKGESSNARGTFPQPHPYPHPHAHPHPHHHRRGKHPAPIPPPFFAPFGRNPAPPMFGLMGKHPNMKVPDVPSFPAGSFPSATHIGIVCDGCDKTPIVGTRYKSNVKEDYDLCSACFARDGNEAEYTPILLPEPPKFFHGLPFQHPRFGHGPSSGTCPMRAKKSKLESRFIQDVTVLDGTLMAPRTPFTKIWRMRNNGSTVWPYGTQLVWVGGDQFASQIFADIEIPINGFPIDNEIDVAVDFAAPARAGRYVSYWRLASPSGQKFGQRVWVLIQVEQPNNDGKSGSLNLNLPPENVMSDGIDMMDINVERINVSYPVVDFLVSQPEPVVTESDPVVAQVDPVVTRVDPVVAQVEPVVAQVEPVGSYPLVDLRPSSSSEPLAEPVQVEKNETGEKEKKKEKEDEDEETLLKELEQMGFKQVDLNKEVLRLNKYDLEQSVGDLCGFAEWDPLLEELKEMGFDDKETNKKLLVKNAGSIKRVVMDLIAGEKAD